MINTTRPNSHLANASAPRTRELANRSEAAAAPRDGFQLSSSADAGLIKPQAPVASAAEKPVRADGMSTLTRIGLGGLAGMVSMMALTGCSEQKPAGPAQVQTQAQKDATSQLSSRLSSIEKEMSGMTGPQSNETVTRKVLDAVKSYAAATGQAGNAASDQVRNMLMEHPALAVAGLAVLGTTAGVLLEKAGMTDAIKGGAAAIYQKAHDNPLTAIAIGAAVAIPAGYLIYQAATAENSVPQKPSTPEARQLDATLTQLENEVQSNPGGDTRSLQGKFMDAVSRYKTQTGKAWGAVTQDVQAFAYAHPILAATLVTGAGVATGVVLERAGVPAAVAGYASGVLQSGEGAASKMGALIKEHPVASSMVAVGISAGVGYLAYQHFNPTPATAPAATPAK